MNRPMRRELSVRRKWPTFVLAFSALSTGAWYWAAPREHAARETLTITRGDISATVNALGTVQPQTAVDVGVQVSGQITRLLVGPGAVVSQGQLLAEIDPALLQATVRAGRAELAGLRAQLAEHQAQHELARQQYARQRQMEVDGATRAEDVQTASASVKVAEARIANLRAQIEQTTARLSGEEAQLGFTRIYAPIAGTVVSVDALAGQTLNATYQTPNLLRIADLSRMTIWTDVSEADIRLIRPGLQARFTTLGDDGRHWTGEVRQVLPASRSQGDGAASADNESRSGRAIFYTVLFDVDNRDGALLPDMTAQVSFVTVSTQNVLTAPLSALQEIEAKPGHFRAWIVNERGHIEEREVRGGAKDRLSVQVLAGLEAGEKLILDSSAGP